MDKHFVRASAREVKQHPILFTESEQAKCLYVLIESARLLCALKSETENVIAARTINECVAVLVFKWHKHLFR